MLRLRPIARRLSSAPAQRVVARVDGSPVLIYNLARYYYDAVAGEVGTRDGGNGDLTGFRLWEAAPHLIGYLDRNRSVVEGRTVLDLGAGTGAVGLAAAALGARKTVLSDADSTVTVASANGWEERGRLATLADNVTLNGRDDVMSVAALRWGDEAHLSSLCSRWPVGFQTIVASDVLYSPRMYDGLEATIRALAAPDAVVVLSYPVRHGDEYTFMERLRPEFECFGREVPTGASASPESESAMRLVELRRVGGRA